LSQETLTSVFVNNCDIDFRRFINIREAKVRVQLNSFLPETIRKLTIEYFDHFDIACISKYSSLETLHIRFVKTVTASKSIKASFKILNQLRIESDKTIDIGLLPTSIRNAKFECKNPNGKITALIDSYRIDISSTDFTDIEFTKNVENVRIDTANGLCVPGKLYPFKSLTILETFGRKWLHEITPNSFPNLQRFLIPNLDPDDEFHQQHLIQLFTRNSKLEYLMFRSISPDFCKTME
jgi:hypothetical protein